MTRVPSMQHPVVAREGGAALSVTLLTGVAAYALFGLAAALPALPALVFLCYFFRDPHRDSPSLPLALVAPVDGRVSRAESAYDPWLGRDAVCVATTMGLLDVHSMFAPTEGKITEQWSSPLFANDALASPTRAVAYLITTDEGDRVTMEIARGVFGGSVDVYYQPGERVGHGRRIGYANMGCKVSLYAAPHSRLLCGAGEQVSAATTVIAAFVHDRPVSAIEPQQDSTSDA